MERQRGHAELFAKPIGYGARVGAAGALDFNRRADKLAVPLFFEMLFPQAQGFVLPKIAGHAHDAVLDIIEQDILGDFVHFFDVDVVDGYRAARHDQ